MRTVEVPKCVSVPHCVAVPVCVPVPKTITEPHCESIICHGNILSLPNNLVAGVAVPNCVSVPKCTPVPRQQCSVISKDVPDTVCVQVDR